MKKTQANGFTWVDGSKTHSEVAKETAAQFDPNEQLKAIMLQVKAMADHLGTPIVPEFQAALDQREAVMADHAQRKANAVPD